MAEPVEGFFNFNYLLHKRQEKVCRKSQDNEKGTRMVTCGCLDFTGASLET